MRRSPAYIETPQIRLPLAMNISHQNIRGVHSEHTQNFIYPSLKCKWPIHTKLLAPNDLISLSYRTQYCVWNDNVYYELKKNRLKYLSATWPVLEDFLGLLKVSLSRHNNLNWNLRLWIWCDLFMLCANNVIMVIDDDVYQSHDDVIKWKHFPRYWPFVRGIHCSSVNSPHNGQWREALMFSLICDWMNGWVNNGEANNLRRYRAIITSL